jgi:hypothetical protein
MCRLITPPVESPLLRGLGGFGRQESPESLRGSPLFSRDTPFEGEGSVSSHDEMAGQEREVSPREVSPREVSPHEVSPCEVSPRDVSDIPEVKFEILSPEEQHRILREDERLFDDMKVNVPSRVSSRSQGPGAQVFREVPQISTEPIDAQPEDPSIWGGRDDDMDDDIPPPPPPPPSYPPPLLNAAKIQDNTHAPRSLSPARDPRKRPALSRELEPAIEIQKNRPTPGQRSVTFSEHNQVHAISPKGASLPVPRRSSLPARMPLENRMLLDGEHPDSSASKRSLEAIPDNVPYTDRSPSKRPRAGYTQTIDFTSTTATYNVIESENVLLTNSYPEWSNYSLIVGKSTSRHDLELFDNTTHRGVSLGRISRNDLLPPGKMLRPVNGTWISPGGVAVLHGRDKWRKNNTQGPSQITIIDYPDINRAEGKPIVTHLQAKPHKGLIWAIVPLWVNNVGCRAFATGGICYRYVTNI